VGGIIAVVGSIAAQISQFQFVWQAALVSGLLYFLISFNNDPKYRFSRYAIWILGSWLLIGQILPNLEAWFKIENDIINGSVHFVSGNNGWLTIVALGLSGFLFWLDFKQNK
jgi:hypothetical protein